jgi:hypothetical protein
LVSNDENYDWSVRKGEQIGEGKVEIGKRPAPIKKLICVQYHKCSEWQELRRPIKNTGGGRAIKKFVVHASEVPG